MYQFESLIEKLTNRPLALLSLRPVASLAGPEMQRDAGHAG
jgi:hypothetical protein